MKSLVFTIVSMITLSASFSLAKDCASSNINIRKVSQTSANSTSKQWVCAAVYQIPFKDRDSNPVVDQCMKSSILYREVNVEQSVACEVLLMADGTRHYVQNKPVPYGWEPVYQSTIPGSNDAN